jgi:hypothetical protein
MIYPYVLSYSNTNGRNLEAKNLATLLVVTTFSLPILYAITRGKEF